MNMSLFMYKPSHRQDVNEKPVSATITNRNQPMQPRGRENTETLNYVYKINE